MKKYLLNITTSIEALFRHPYMARLSRRHPKVFSFLRDRLDPGNFFGLPFTILVLIMGTNAALLTEVAEKVVNSEKMKSLDQNVSLFFFQLRTDKVSLAMYCFTQLGSVGGMAAVTALAALLV